jgi:mRNA interferase MazF
MKRGDIVIAVTPGDYGKPRPAAVVQSDIFNPIHASITLCPITSHLVDAPLFRLSLQPTAENGLGVSSQIMVDKITTVRKEKLRQAIGRLTSAEIDTLNRALYLWLGLNR